MTFNQLANFTDILGDEICNSQPYSLPSSDASSSQRSKQNFENTDKFRPAKGMGQHGQYRSVEEIDPKYREVFTYPLFNLVQSSVIEDALYSDKSLVVCAPTGSGKTVIFEMAIVQLLMELENSQRNDDFKIIYMAPVKALCTEKLTEWYPKLTKLGLLCIEVTGDTDVDFSQLKPYRLIITTPEKWDMLTRRWRDHKGLVEIIKLFLIDEVHILNDEVRGPVLEAVVSRMKTIESSVQSAHRIEQLQHELQGAVKSTRSSRPRIRFVAVSATVSNPEDVASWLGTPDKPAVFYKFGDECRPVKLKRIVEGYPCPDGTSIFKFDIILNYRLWPIIQKYHDGKPTLIFCNTRKSVLLTAETLSRELTICFNPEQKAKLTALASTIKNKKLQSLVMSGVGCHHAGLLFEERLNIERAFRNRDLPILITTTTLAMGVNLPAHLVIVKNTQQYVNGAYQEYSISTVLQMVGRAGRPQYDTEATAVIMTRLADKPRYQALVGGSEPLQSYLHKRVAENLNSEAALKTVGDVAQCVQWLRSTFLFVRAAKDPKRYLGLPQNSPQHLISKKIEELCVKAMNGLASSGLITMDEASCIESTEAGRLMSIFYLDLETMRHIMKLEGNENLERMVWLICESHELADMHLRADERRCLNALNRNSSAPTIRFPMKGKITTRQMKLNCVIQAVLGCLSIPDPSLGQEAMKIMRIADRVCKCLVAYVTRSDLISNQPQFYSAVLNALILAKCIAAHLWENSPYVSKQLKGIGPTFSTLLATAGKVNFLLLEESHPRDLERIMNKGPPAGNILRKQIGLLPKYQLVISPVDENTITLQLTLLNLAHLSENMEALTAGDNHKSYLVVGDSNNNLLLLTSFKDKDLICAYDGMIKYDIKRKHDFEHKLFAHCISSSFVGIDVQAEYSFNDLEGYSPIVNANVHDRPLPIKPIKKKQTCITDTFKERKRKNTNEIDITQFLEKKKRDNALMEKFKSLKESFNFTSKRLKESAQSQVLNGQKEVDNLMNVDEHPIINDIAEEKTSPINAADINILSLNTYNVDDIDCNEDIDSEQINNILHEIENEITKNKSHTQNCVDDIPKGNINPHRAPCLDNANFANLQANILESSTMNTNIKMGTYKNIGARKKCKPVNKPNNYNFIELLERNVDFSDEEANLVESNNNSFSNTIKFHVEKYLQKAQNKTNLPDKNVERLLDDTRDVTDNVLSQPVKSLAHTPNTTDSPSSTIHYEIKEILKPTNNEKQVRKSDGPVKANPDDIDNIKDEHENKNVYDIINDRFTIQDSNNTSINYKAGELLSYCDKANATGVCDNYINNDIEITTNTIHNNKIIEDNLEVHCVKSEDNLKGSTEIAILPKNIVLNIKDISEERSHNTALDNRTNDNDHSFKNSLQERFCKDISTKCCPSDLSKVSHKNDSYNEKDEYVYNYAFTAIGVNSTIKDSIKIVRKIKMDVKVNEIISTERSNNTPTELNSDENSDERQKLVKSINDLQRLQDNAYERSLKSLVPVCRDIAMRSDITIETLPKPAWNAVQFRRDLNKGDTSFKNKFEIKEIEGAQNLLPGIKLKNNTPKSDLKEQDNTDVRLTSETTSKDFKPENNKVPQKVDKIENIFQKYSKILCTKEPTKSLTPAFVNTTEANSTNSNKPSVTKPVRPFKITEIHKQRASIPNTIINGTPVSDGLSSPIRRDIVSTPQAKLEMFTIPPVEHTKDVENNYDCPEYQYPTVDLEELEIPVELEPIIDYKIDHSMFDPRALLQCAVKKDDKDVIPPPPEFCDELNYSPEYQDIDTVKYYNQWCAESQDNRDAVYDLDESIFEDNCAMELTPSKEIETWTLSHEDSWEEPETMPLKSFTVMRRTAPDADGTCFAAVPRRAELSKFKFNHKNKLKVRR